MKLRQFIFFTILLWLVASCEQKYKPPITDWNKENLKGNVKTIYLKRFFLDSTGVLRDSSDWNKIDSFPTEIIEFNTKGYIKSYVDASCFFGGGAINYNYSDSDTRLQKIYYGPNFGQGKRETYFEYDSKGRLKEVIIREPKRQDSSIIKFVKYDYRGNILKEIHSFINDSIDYYIIRVFDDKNQLLEENKFGLKDKIPKSKITNKYDTRGNNIYTEYYELDNRNWGWINIESFDDNGNALKSETSYFEYGKATRKYEYELRYEYDSLGNWIQSIRTEKGIDKEVKKRKIVYW